MQKNFLVVLVIFLIVPSYLCVEKFLRAYIPKESVVWFERFIRDKPEIDVWLSIRQNNYAGVSNTKYSSEFQKKFKYLCEFKTSNFDLIKKHKIDFELNQIKLEVLIEDVVKHLSEDPNHKENKYHRRAKRYYTSTFNTKYTNLGSIVVGKYASYSNITDWMFELVKKYPNLVQVFKIGRTFERRFIYALKMTENPRDRNTKPLFLFEGGIHAREWLSVTTSVFIIDRFIKQYLESDQIIKNILKRFELHFIPVLNPDGYEYSRASKFNRFWRKNMRYTKIHSSEHSCYGVDLNRNFDHKWMVSGASANPCSEVFSGPYPASEPEIRALTKYIMNKSPRWISYISLHSYGALWLSPFSYSRLHIHDNFEESCQKAMIAIKKIEKLHNFTFKFGPASHELYEASGCGEDWAKEVAKINHTFVIELKPEKSEDFEHSGFELSESKVPQVALEMYDGFVEYIKSFLMKNVDESIVKLCKAKLREINKEIQNYDYEIIENDDFLVSLNQTIS